MIFCCIWPFVHKYILSISWWWLIKLSNVFVFPDTELPIKNILYGWSEIWDKFGLYCFMFSPVTSSSMILALFYYISIFNFYIFPYFINFVLHTLLVPVTYGYDFIPLFVFSPLSSLAVNAILLFFSVNILSASL